MNEPLNISSHRTSFSGKTYNKHPQWYNQPLRLTKEQKHDPLTVFDDFFEDFHLNEVREILWQWLSEVLSSNNSISTDSHSRNNHIYFYEKMEILVEAALVIKKRMRKRLLYQGRQPLEKYSCRQRLDDTAFNKPASLIEKANNNPVSVIKEVFNSESLDFLRDKLYSWQQIALSADNTAYDEATQRANLLTFHDQLQSLAEALYISIAENADIKTVLLSKDQASDPLTVISHFFDKFPMSYVRRELDDWLEAGIGFTGTYPENMNRLDVLFTYRNIYCLVKAAFRLLKTGKLTH